MKTNQPKETTQDAKAEPAPSKLKFKILINYDTGDSFNTERDLESELDYVWTNLDRAIESLERIRNHYKIYQDINNCRATKEFVKNKLNFASRQPWFRSKECWEYTIILVTDDNTPYPVQTFWCGYFETLNSIKIEIIGKGLEYSF